MGTLRLAAGGSTCHPSYSGGRVQEDRGSKPDQASSSRASPISKKKPSLKMAGVGLEFKSQYHTHKIYIYNVTKIS
jgi:hypothetical protein